MFIADKTKKKCLVACDERTKKDGRCTCLSKSADTKQLLQTAVSGSVDRQKLVLQPYNNAVVSRFHNKRISVIRDKKINHIRLTRVLEKGENIDIPTCVYDVIKGKIAVTSFGLSDEGLEALYIAIGHYLQGGYTTDR